MIIDTLENIVRYAALNPYFPQVVEFLANNDINKLPLGKTVISEKVFVNVVDSPVRSREEAKLETHNKMIDLQIPLSSWEEHGYCHRSQLPEADYDDANDISFYDVPCHGYITLQPRQFAIYFPEDGHAPAISPTGLRKAIFKISVA